MFPNKIISLLLRFSFAIAVAFPLLSCDEQDSTTPKTSELRMLAWVGYDEPDFLEPLERELGAKISVKTYVGGDQMYSLFRSAPAGTYDIVVVDAEYGKRMFEEDLLTPMSTDLWQVAGLFQPFDQGTPVRIGDKVFAAVVRWGAIGLVYNRKFLSAEQASDYKILWDPLVKGRVGMFDWYLPNMGVISKYLGNSSPYNLSNEQLRDLRKALLTLRPQVRTIHPNTGDVIADLRNEEVVITPGIGEWAAAVLAEEGKDIDWIIPKQGGVMWVEALAIPVTAKNSELATRFIKLVQTPENMARLAWRKAYHSQVPRQEAYLLMTPTQRQLLKAENDTKLQQLIATLSIRELPGPRTSEAEWLGVWTDFKVGARE